MALLAASFFLPQPWYRAALIAQLAFYALSIVALVGLKIGPLSRLADHPNVPTPVGVFRDVERPTYEAEMQAQLVHAAERSGPGELNALLRSAPTWTVE